MRHEHFKDMLPLLLYDELEAGDREDLERHLVSCDECRAEFEAMKRLFLGLEEGRSLDPTERELEAARNDLARALERERAVLESGAATGTGRAFRTGTELPPRPSLFPTRWLRVGLVALAAAVLGFTIGRMTPGTAPHEPPLRVSRRPAPDPFLDADAVVTSVRFADPYGDPLTSDEEVELVYEAVRPARLRGTIDDARVRRLLLHALIQEENPGTRLQAASAIASVGRRPLGADVKRALIEALMFDENAAVRQKALGVLQTWPFDEEIKKALLYVLLNDSNPGLRVAVINGLEMRTFRPLAADERTIEALEEAVASETNGYVRLQSQTLLQEVSE